MTINEKKVIGSYKARFKTRFDEKDGEFIYLQISISDNLKKLLNDISVEGEYIEDFYNGDSYSHFPRSLIKKPFAGLVERSVFLLFDKTFLKVGKIEFKLTNVNRVDQLMKDFKDGLKLLIQSYLKYSHIDVTLNFNTGK